MGFKVLIRNGETQSQEMWQRILGLQFTSLAGVAGVGSGFSAYAVGVINGAHGSDPNHFAVSADTVDMILTARGGWLIGQLDAGTTSFDPRNYLIENSATSSVTIGANSSGTTRVDTVCIRLDITIAPDQVGSNLPSLYVVQGGASSALGNAPADAGTGALYFPLCNVTVANGATSLSNSNIADLRPTTGGAQPSTRPIQYFGTSGALTGGSPAVATTTLLYQAGTFTPTTDGGGNFVLTFPTAFPNGLLMVHAENGDQTTSVNMLMTSAIGSVSKSSVSFRAWNVNSNAGFLTSTIRCNWWAVGW